MEWLNDSNKLRIQEEKEERKKIESTLLNEIKSKHLAEKKEELEKLKKRIEILENEIGCYQ